MQVVMGGPVEVAMQRTETGLGDPVEQKLSLRQRARGKINKLFLSRSPRKEVSRTTQAPPPSLLSSAEDFGPEPGSHQRGGDSSPSGEQTQSTNERQSVDHMVLMEDHAFMCPISKTLMSDPVTVLSSGVSYERRVIQSYLERGHTKCVKKGTSLDSNSFYDNGSLKTAIEQWCDSNGVPRPVSPSPEAAMDAVDRLCPPSVNGDGLVETPASEVLGTDTPSPSESSIEGLGPARGSKHSGSDQVRDPVIPEDKPLKEEILPGFGDLNPRAGNRFQPSHTWSGDEFSKQSSDLLGTGRPSYARQEPVGNVHRSSPSSSISSTHAHTMTVSGSPRPNNVVEHPRDAVPLPLATTPASFGTAPSTVSDSSGGLDDATINHLVSKLSHNQVREQEEAVVEIRRLTRISAQNRLALCEPDVLEALLPLMQSRYPKVQINAVASVMNLSLERENKLRVPRTGAIPFLIDVLKSGVEEAQEHAAGAIFSLALNDDNKMAIGVLGAIPPLIHLLRSDQQGARRDAAMALYHLSFSQMNRSKLIKAGGVGTFLEIVRDERSDVVSRALLILVNLAAIQEGRAALAEKDAVPILVSLLTRGDEERGRVVEPEEQVVNWEEVREHAAAALLQLSQHNVRFKSQAMRAGAMEGLQRLEVEGTPRAREKASALLSVLRDVPRGQDDSSGSHATVYPRRAFVRPGGDLEKSESSVF